MATEPQKSFDFMTAQSGWPKWPVLPLKRTRDDDLEVGFLYANKAPTVYLANIYAASGTQLKDLPSKTYKTFNDLIADGWRVD